MIELVGLEGGVGRRVVDVLPLRLVAHLPLLIETALAELLVHLVDALLLVQLLRLSVARAEPRGLLHVLLAPHGHLRRSLRLKLVVALLHERALPGRLLAHRCCCRE